MTDLKPCSHCHELPFTDWMTVDVESEWRCFAIECSNEWCDTALSAEMHSLKPQQAASIEYALTLAWNMIHA